MFNEVALNEVRPADNGLAPVFTFPVPTSAAWHKDATIPAEADADSYDSTHAYDTDSYYDSSSTAAASPWSKETKETSP